MSNDPKTKKPVDLQAEWPQTVRDAIARMGLDPKARFVVGALLDCEPAVDREPVEIDGEKMATIMNIGPVGRTARRMVLDDGSFAGFLAGAGAEEWQLAANPDEIAKFTPAEVQYIVAHEGLHKLRGDPFLLHRWSRDKHVRGRPYLETIAQLSMDAAVNDFLNEENKLAMEKGRPMGPYGVAPPSAFLWDKITWDLSQEEAYCRLYDSLNPPPPKNGQGKGNSQSGKSPPKGKGFGPDCNGKPKGDQQGDGEGEGEGQSYVGQMSEGELNERVNQARQDFAREIERQVNAGNITGDKARNLMETMKPTYSLEELLERTLPDLLEGIGPEDYRRPQRRTVYRVTDALERGEKVCLQPTQVSFKVGPVAIIVDVSGSMMQEDLAKAFGVVADVLERYHPEKVMMMAADVGETAFHELEGPDDLRSFDVRGGGGTDMGRALEDMRKYIDAENMDAPILTIVATDGYTPWPARDVGFPVVAIITQESEAPPNWITTIRWG